jgi:hypothetical protein
MDARNIQIMNKQKYLQNVFMYCSRALGFRHILCYSENELFSLGKATNREL